MKSRNADRYIKASLLVRALKSELANAITAQTLAGGKLTGGQRAYADRRLATLEPQTTVRMVMKVTLPSDADDVR